MVKSESEELRIQCDQFKKEKENLESDLKKVSSRLDTVSTMVSRLVHQSLTLGSLRVSISQMDATRGSYTVMKKCTRMRSQVWFFPFIIYRRCAHHFKFIVGACWTVSQHSILDY